MPPRVVLVGPMGAGKTTVAELLGAAWGVPVRDTDADVVATTGREISDIFVEDGEDHFRDLEAEAVARALAEHDGVLALGGGAVLRVGTRELLAGVPVVFSRVCTDVGCPVTYDRGSACFLGPCHGGIFTQDGTPIHGPPPRPLYRYAARVRDGVLEIDLNSLPPQT